MRSTRQRLSDCRRTMAGTIRRQTVHSDGFEEGQSLLNASFGAGNVKLATMDEQIPAPALARLRNTFGYPDNARDDHEAASMARSDFNEVIIPPCARLGQPHHSAIFQNADLADTACREKLSFATCDPADVFQIALKFDLSM